VKIALVTLNDSTDVHQWSGLNFFIARALEGAGASVHRIGPLESTWTLGMRIRQRVYDTLGRDYHAIIDPASLAGMGTSARARIPAEVDAVVSVTSLVAAAVGKLSLTHVSWDDATNAAMEQYYPDFRRMAGISRRHSMMLGQKAVDAVDLAIYASEWAASSARSAYGLAKERVAVVPFGANLDPLPGSALINDAIQSRPADQCRLLWIGVDWERKGGPLTLDIARALRESGVPVELTLVGCEPDERESLPEWVQVLGFISKRDAAGRERLAELFARAHFFVMPSHAEAYGLVYAEASAFGVPSVALRTGGVPTIILDGDTGVLAPPDSSPVQIAERMAAIFRDRGTYASMARAARRRFEQTLNWEVAGREVIRLIEQVGTTKR
jgi:glycosyltransferase involved in cell wall biosynthesis